CFDNLLANGQARPGAFVFLAAMQPPEDAEDLLMVLRVDAQSVVPDEQRYEWETRINEGFPASILRYPADDHFRAGAFVVLEAVADQIREQLHDALGITAHRGERSLNAYSGLTPLNQVAEVSQNGT